MHGKPPVPGPVSPVLITTLRTCPPGRKGAFGERRETIGERRRGAAPHSVLPESRNILYKNTIKNINLPLHFG